MTTTSREAKTSSTSTAPRRVTRRRGGTPVSWSRERWVAAAPTGALTLALVLAGTFLVRQARHLWFFGDDFEFLLTRGTVPGADRGLFMPHNEHWSTVPILVFRALFSVFGLRHYLPYALVVILAHLALCVVIYVFLRRVQVSAWAAVAVCTFLAFFGAGAENTLWDFQVGFVGAVLFGYMALLLFDQVERAHWRLWPVWVASILSLMSAGVGLPLLGMLGIYATARRGLRYGLQVVSVPALTYGVWWLIIGHQGAREQGSALGRFLLVPQFLWTGLTEVWNTSLGIPASGAVVLLTIAVVALITGGGTSPAARHAALAGLLGASLMFLAAGQTRAVDGAMSAIPGRYLYVGAALMLPGTAVVVDHGLRRLGRPTWVSSAAVLGVLCLFVVNGMHLATSFTKTRGALTTVTAQRVLGAAWLVGSGATILTPEADPTYNPDVNTSLLATPEVQRALPDSEPSAQTLLNASSAIQVGVQSKSFGLPAPVEVRAANGLTATTSADAGCQTWNVVSVPAQLDVKVGSGGGQVHLTQWPGVLQTALRVGGQTSDPAVRWTTAAAPSYVATVVPDSTLLIQLTSVGAVSTCSS